MTETEFVRSATPLKASNVRYCTLCLCFFVALVGWSAHVADARAGSQAPANECFPPQVDDVVDGAVYQQCMYNTKSVRSTTAALNAALTDLEHVHMAINSKQCFAVLFHNPIM